MLGITSVSLSRRVVDGAGDFIKNSTTFSRENCPGEEVCVALDLRSSRILLLASEQTAAGNYFIESLRLVSNGGQHN